MLFLACINPTVEAEKLGILSFYCLYTVVVTIWPLIDLGSYIKPQAVGCLRKWCKSQQNFKQYIGSLTATESFNEISLGLCGPKP